MALSSKEYKLAQSFRKRLQHLSCPFTEGVDDAWIVELLYRPGEPRIRLLQWLLTKFDTGLSDMLDPQYVSADRKMDSRLQRILFVASTLGLCDLEDADLIRGTVSISKQTAFMDQLIDLVYIRDFADDPKNKGMQSPGMIGSATDLEIQFSNDCEFMDTLISNENISDLFMNRTKLLPPDLTKKVETGVLDRGYKEIKSVPQPDTGKLIDAAKEFATDLQKQNEILEELDKYGDYPEKEAQAQEKVNRTLRLVLSELSQLLVGFSYCFENELRPWCNKAPPELIQLGPVMKRVHGLLQQFTQLMQSLTAIQSNHSQLCGNLRDELNKINRKLGENNSNPAVKSIAEYFQQCTDVLEESLSHADSNEYSLDVTGVSNILKLR